MFKVDFAELKFDSVSAGSTSQIYISHPFSDYCHQDEQKNMHV